MRRVKAGRVKWDPVDFAIAGLLVLVSLYLAVHIIVALTLGGGGRCAEDDPCWNCHTMGNKVCGP